MARAAVNANSVLGSDVLSSNVTGCERPLTFTLFSDPFYSESNMRYLERKMEDYKAGKLKFAEHELIEE